MSGIMVPEAGYLAETASVLAAISTARYCTEFLIIDEIRLLLMNILVKFLPDIHILMVMGGRLTRYTPKIGRVPVRSS
jgi:hypothetical protein